MVDEPRGISGVGAVHRHLAVQPERVAAPDVVRQLAAERRSDPRNANIDIVRERAPAALERGLVDELSDVL